MISVILPSEKFLHFFHCVLIFSSQLYGGFFEKCFQLILGDTAQGFVPFIHTDILRLVKSTENTYLGKLCYSGQQYESQVLIGSFKGRIKGFQYFPVLQQNLLSIIIIKTSFRI